MSIYFPGFLLTRISWSTYFTCCCTVIDHCYTKYYLLYHYLLLVSDTWINFQAIFISFYQIIVLTFSPSTTFYHFIHSSYAFWQTTVTRWDFSWETEMLLYLKSLYQVEINYATKNVRFVIELLNPFHATVVFLHPLKTSENTWFLVFSGCKERPLARNWLR